MILELHILLIELVIELVVAIYVIALAIVIAVVDLDGELIYSTELEDEDVPELQIMRAGKGTPPTPKVHVASGIHV
jgi:hypothetical protein